MALRPIQQDQVQKTVQVLLAFLSDDNVSIPGSMLEGIYSGKSLLRGIISGNLLVCENADAQSGAAPPVPPVPPVVEGDEDGSPEAEGLES